jgi:hypothetical protein
MLGSIVVFAIDGLPGLFDVRRSRLKSSTLYLGPLDALSNVDSINGGKEGALLTLCDFVCLMDR